MLPVNFTSDKVIQKHGAQLLSIFNEIGAKSMIELLGQILSQKDQNMNDNTETRVKALKEKIESLKNDRPIPNQY